MKLSEIVHKAIEEHLNEGTSSFCDKEWYSCHALGRALDETLRLDEQQRDMLYSIPKEMGLDVIGCREFDEFTAGEERQYARALWLTFLELWSEEEGL